MTSNAMNDVIRGLTAPIARLFDVAVRRAGEGCAGGGAVRLSRRDRAALRNLDDRLLMDVGLVRDGDQYRPR